jgi:hypothetical protein
MSLVKAAASGRLLISRVIFFRSHSQIIFSRLFPSLDLTLGFHSHSRKDGALSLFYPISILIIIVIIMATLAWLF